MPKLLTLLMAAGLMAYAIAIPPTQPPVEASCVNETEPNNHHGEADGLHALVTCCWTGNCDWGAIDKDFAYALVTRVAGEYTQEMRFTADSQCVLYIEQPAGTNIHIEPLWNFAGGTVDFEFTYEGGPDNVYLWVETPTGGPGDANYTVEAL